MTFSFVNVDLTQKKSPEGLRVHGAAAHALDTALAAMSASNASCLVEFT